MYAIGYLGFRGSASKKYLRKLRVRGKDKSQVNDPIH